MKRIHVAAFLIVAATTTSIGSAQWVQTPSGNPWNWTSHTAQQYSTPGPDHINNTQSSITIAGEYFYDWYFQVTGADDTSPPWSSLFTPKTFQSVGVRRTYSKTLGPQLGGKVLDVYSVDEGTEAWAQNGVVRTRNMLKYTMVEQGKLITWPVGGGGNPD